MQKERNLTEIFLRELKKRGVLVKHIEGCTYSIAGAKCYVTYANLSKYNTYWFGITEKDIFGQAPGDTHAALVCGKDSKTTSISLTIFLMPFSTLAEFLKKEVAHRENMYHFLIYPDRNYQMVAKGKCMDIRKYAVSFDTFITKVSSLPPLPEKQQENKIKTQDDESDSESSDSGLQELYWDWRNNPELLEKGLSCWMELMERKLKGEAVPIVSDLDSFYRKLGYKLTDVQVQGLVHKKGIFHQYVRRECNIDFNPTVGFWREKGLEKLIEFKKAVQAKLKSEEASSLGETDSTKQTISQSIQEYHPTPHKGQDEELASDINHKELILHLLELGEIKGFKAHREYSCDNYRIDTIWTTEFSEVPKYCFEVHIAGNLYKDFAALKHAYDKWNSKIFLICTESDLQKAKDMTAGSFHEIKNKIEILDAQELLEYCLFKEKFKEIDRLLN